MTRENKLAVVVGFGLILFVGILISDHFSTAGRQSSADLLQVADQNASVRQRDPSLIDIVGPAPRRRPPIDAGTPAVNPTQLSEEADVRRMNDGRNSGSGVAAVNPQFLVPETQAPQPQRETLIPVTPTSPSAQTLATHEVQPRESMMAIARRYYGDGKLAKQLARFNNIDDPDTVRAGAKLRLPTYEQLTGRSAPTGTPNVPAAPTRTASNETTSPALRTTTYTIKPGETLSQIASKVMGSSKKWEELYSMNVDVIDDPDNVKAGTVLKVPKRG